jgi:hypothetical protein
MKVAYSVEWDSLENEDVLIGISSSLQVLGHFPFHGGEGTSREPMETRHTARLPEESTEVGGSTVMPQEPMEAGSSAFAPQEPRGARHSVTVPQEPSGVSPST